MLSEKEDQPFQRTGHRVCFDLGFFCVCVFVSVTVRHLYLTPPLIFLNFYTQKGKV